VFNRLWNVNGNGTEDVMGKFDDDDTWA